MKNLLFNPLKHFRYFSMVLLFLHFVSCATYQNSSYYDADGIYGGEVKAKPKIQSNDYYQSYFSNLKNTTTDTLAVLPPVNKQRKDSLKTNTTIVNVYPSNWHTTIRIGSPYYRSPYNNFYWNYSYNDWDYYYGCNYYDSYYGCYNNGYYNYGWPYNYYSNPYYYGYFNYYGYNNNVYRYSTGRRGQSYSNPNPTRRYSQGTEQNVNRVYNFSPDTQQQVNRRRDIQPQRTYTPVNNDNQSTRQSSTPTRSYSPPQQQETRSETRSYNYNTGGGNSGGGTSPSSGGRRR